ncbi:hypothetical protein AVEN_49919-1 [Araneus ventricosus]|uniref:Uncharacterized protein n=1 Tax=Araneus ventricosus TaxID=182803 RepID=A0A4Y2UH58_ARAVE|nr:hypothetical protein AVEN_49919-1 [Araneus ventricosus]
MVSNNCTKKIDTPSERAHYCRSNERLFFPLRIARQLLDTLTGSSVLQLRASVDGKGRAVGSRQLQRGYLQAKRDVFLSCQHVNMASRINAPAECELRSIIRFLQAEGISAAEIHRRKSRVTVATLWVIVLCMDGQGCFIHWAIAPFEPKEP